MIFVPAAFKVITLNHTRSSLRLRLCACRSGCQGTLTAVVTQFPERSRDTLRVPDTHLLRDVRQLINTFLLVIIFSFAT